MSARKQSGAAPDPVDAEMRALRGEIDRMDRQIMRLLVKRFDSCVKVGIRKRALNLAVKQPERIVEVTERAASAAVAAGLSAGFGRAVWHLIIQEASALEKLRL
jgi:chorismate mutase-like protein